MKGVGTSKWWDPMTGVYVMGCVLVRVLLL